MTRLAFPVLAVVAAGLRLGAMAFEPNSDLGSYEIVGELQADGRNVYANTFLYNYGPAWFILLGWLWQLSELLVGDDGAYRLLIVLVLTTADLSIGYMLLRRFGLGASALFLLNPLSILITGQHNQFDNIAIAIGFAAVLVIGDEREGPVTRRQLAGLAVLSLSIIVKHVLFFLPVWLGMRQRDRQRFLVYSAVPMLIFGASFLPWIIDGWQGIYDNVLSYRSFQNAPLVNILTFGTLGPDALAQLGSLLFFAAMVAVGWLVRGRSSLTMLMAMLVAVVVFAPATANQYLAIPAAAIAAYPNIVFGLFAVAGTVFLVGDPLGLGFDGWVLPFFDRDRVTDDRIYDVLILLLAAGAAWWWLRDRGYFHSWRSSRRLPNGSSTYTRS